MKSDILMIKSRSFLLRMRNVSNKRRKENQNTYFVISKFYFWKSCQLGDSVEEYDTDNNMAHWQCMLDT